ncbi:YjiH family protein [Salimicrobium halophilum]|uniref:Nucleoside recognition GATE domain-containing membrane protein YjiH n=1 Tax=Salimicrobium halophilum TaxID=86666 RepID=A0A1G8SQS9_9BACI|nr:YjiH family protein [Salimicrobium halophilum]SDJ31592.1 nucleoside recognition GATE domain-containing membrane protein YjiH [Salimicrobium halophilum]
MNNQKYPTSAHLRFIIPSLIGILLFMIPIPSGESMTILVAIFAGWLESALKDYLSLIMTFIITLTAVLTLWVKAGGRNVVKSSPFFTSLLDVTPFWTIVRVLGMIFALMVYFQVGPEAIISDVTGGLLLDSLLHVLFTVFLFAGLFLPLLLNYGLLELFGILLTKIMRPLFTLPGRSSIDSLASWLGDGTIGVLLTSKQYEEGYYTKREAAVIGTTFSVVSITFTIVVIEELGLGSMFVPLYGTIVLTGVITALIMPRIPPLSKKPDTFVTEEPRVRGDQTPKEHNAFTYGYQQAVKQGSQSPGLAGFFKNGAQNILDMWMGVAPIVMALGTIALVLAEFTPLFTWLGVPFIPILELLQIPSAQAASETILIGFADMFLPAIIGASIESEMTRFVIAALSVTQLIYMSEVGGLLLGSKVPVGMKDLFIIFLERTIISLPIIAFIAHLLF